MDVSDLEKSSLPARKNWEYKIVRERNIGLEEELNKLGSEGWEMVSAVRDSNDWIKFIFKREKFGSNE